jgi:hypothetical protein
MKKIVVSLLCLTLFASTSFAWNRAGHMVTGAIAYNELKTNHPGTLKQVLALLQQHPEYKSKWEEAIKDLPDKNENHDLYIFMMAARWADDVRDNPTFNHPTWHYINYPLTFQSGVATRESDSVNIMSALQNNFNELGRPGASDADKAVALAWLFHLIGDLHQPLHTTALFSAEFPNGDKGGNDFKIIAEEGGKTINLHSYWDGVVIGSDNFQQVKNQAILIRNNLNLQPKKLSELSQDNFSVWARDESFPLARDVVYEKGALKSGSVLSQSYRDKSKEIGERRVALAGYRIALKMRDIFEFAGPGKVPPPPPLASAVGSPIGNKKSKVYHLPACPDYAKVAEQNRVPFASEAAAQKAGYKKAKNCP